MLLGIAMGAIAVLWYQAIDRACKKSEEANLETATIIWRQNHFMLTEENLMNELKAQEVMFPEIVLAQALLESDNFRSYSCTHRNNLFGLRKGESYMSFPHWTECVAAYKKYIQKRKGDPPKDYFDYLDSLGYAEDKSYTTVLKQMVR